MRKKKKCKETMKEHFHKNWEKVKKKYYGNKEKRNTGITRNEKATKNENNSLSSDTIPFYSISFKLLFIYHQHHHLHLYHNHHHHNHHNHHNHHHHHHHNSMARRDAHSSIHSHTRLPSTLSPSSLPTTSFALSLNPSRLPAPYVLQDPFHLASSSSAAVIVS